jgi:Predicted phosphoesterase (MutT family)
MGKMDEQIIVVRRTLLFGTDNDQDLTFQGTEQRRQKVAELEDRMAAHYQVMRRGDAEQDPEFKQPIPYALLRKGDRYFSYERLGGGAEQRLHGKLSLGVGGHMNQVDGEENFRELLAANLKRELTEELILTGADLSQIRTIGLINDDASEVGRVHIGVLVIVDLPDDCLVTVKEKDKLSGSWRNFSALREKEVYRRMESWSALALDALAEKRD